MGIRTKSAFSQRGAAMVEFSLAMIFLTPLVLGTFVFGFRLIRSVEMMQITRDLGHMYVRGINFRNPGPQNDAQTLAAQYALTATGSSVVRLSQVSIVQQSDCDAAGTAPAGTPCPNLNQPVFVEQLTLGNSSSGASAFGTPPLQGDYTVSTASRANAPGAVANGFGSVLALKPNETAYVAEMINLTPDLNIPGMTGRPQVYSRSIF